MAGTCAREVGVPLTKRQVVDIMLALNEQAVTLKAASLLAAQRDDAQHKLDSAERYKRTANYINNYWLNHGYE